MGLDALLGQSYRDSLGRSDANQHQLAQLDEAARAQRDASPLKE